ncbi:hypothetical protein CDAR_276671 [Caerostris darwini]|uniref:Amino acid transporter n=1 Tax=Caerostris darwini TaxID=1538125 RepID=A0AAV4TQR8_9ARAC|nr:hypothetical protein CDAR_276671 [Caerostris darwini]
METNTSRSRSMSLPIIWGALELSDEGILKLCSQTSFVDSELLKAHETAVIKILAVQKQQLEKGYTHCITYQRECAKKELDGESPDVASDPSKTNGTHSTVVHMPVNGHSKNSPDDDVFPLSDKLMDTTDSKKKDRHPVYQCLRGNLLTIATFAGVLLGIGLGLGLRGAKVWTKREVMYVNFFGELFLNMLKCLILPLIVSSLTSALGMLDARLTGKIGSRAVAYYMITTVMAIILGIILVLSIKPGVGGSIEVSDGDKPSSRPTLPEDTIMDLFRNMFLPILSKLVSNSIQAVLKKPKDFNETGNDTGETF